MVKLSDYTENNPPRLVLLRQVLHPQNKGQTIGHVAKDDNRLGSDQVVALFPRTKSEHYFRKVGENGGYGISESVLDVIEGKAPHGEYEVSRILIVEKDEGRVIEFDPVSFRKGALALYDPEENEGVVSEDGEEPDVDHMKYRDRQRVAPIEEVTVEWDRDDISIHRR